MNSVRKLMLTIVYHPHAVRLAAVGLALLGLVFSPLGSPAGGGGGV